MDSILIPASQRLAEYDFNMTFDGININVLWFRAMSLKSGNIISRHRHSSFEFHVVKDGACRVILDDGECTVQKGQMYITPPSVFHEQQSCGSTDYLEYCINFDIKQDGTPDTEGQTVYSVYKNMPFTMADNSKNIEELFELAFKKAAEPRLGSYSDIKHLIFMIINAAAETASPKSEVSHNSVKKNDSNALRFKKIERYIIDNLSACVKVSDIAKIMFLSEKQIGRIIKYYTGKSAKEYILSLRHEKAKEYLKYSDLSISAISEKLSFSSVQYFVSFFLKREGYTPLIFRKNMIIK